MEFALILLVFCYLFKEPILYLFGASSASYQYADAYLSIYLFGTPFAMITSGMNGFSHKPVKRMGQPVQDTHSDSVFYLLL